MSLALKTFFTDEEIPEIHHEIRRFLFGNSNEDCILLMKKGVIKTALSKNSSYELGENSFSKLSALFDERLQAEDANYLSTYLKNTLCFSVKDGSIEIIGINADGRTVAKYKGNEITIDYNGTKYIEVSEDFLATLKASFSTLRLRWNNDFGKLYYEIVGEDTPKEQDPSLSLPRFNGIRVILYIYSGKVSLMPFSDIFDALPCATFDDTRKLKEVLTPVWQDELAQEIIGKSIQIY